MSAAGIGKSRKVQLGVKDAARLKALEAVIERGLPHFEAVGRALTEVRDSRLYQAEFPTFEKYCQTRWRLARASAYRFITAAKTIEEMAAVSPNGDKPKTEAVARELGKIKDPAERSEHLAKVSEQVGRPPTAKELAAIGVAPAVVTAAVPVVLILTADDYLRRLRDFAKTTQTFTDPANRQLEPQDPDRIMRVIVKLEGDLQDLAASLGGPVVAAE